MNKAVFLILALGTCLWVGCAGTFANCHPSSGSAVAKAIDNVGGLPRWQKAKTISSDALVTIYDEQGQAHITKQRHTFDVQEGRLTATATLPDGSWQAVVYLPKRGKDSFKSDGVTLTAPEQLRLLAAMHTVLERAFGPMNFCLGEKAGKEEMSRVEGTDMIRVAVDSSPQGSVAYYLDAQDLVLSYITTGADRPGGKGTITRYRWQMASNGLSFPASIEVLTLGRDVLIGDAPILELAYGKVEVQ